MEKLLSIIVPVYNIKNYLSQCIDSINCIRNDYELILVDDGSSDGSSEVCDYYAAKYDHIHVIHQKNQGVSVARNTGILNSKGRYIYFVDGDDWVQGIENIFSYLETNDEIIALNFDILDKNNLIVRKHTGPNLKFPVSSFYTYYNRHFHTLWGFIFRKDIIDKYSISFNKELKYSEDWVFVVKYLSKIKYITPINVVTYKYRKEREGSAMNQGYDQNKIISHFIAFRQIKEIKAIPENINYVKNEAVDCFSYILNLIISNHSELDISILQNYIRRNLTYDLFFYGRLKYTIKFIIAYINIKILIIFKKI